MANVEEDSTELDTMSVELLKIGNGGFVDEAGAGVVALAAADVPVRLCRGSLFAAARSRLRNKRNTAKRKHRMEAIVGTRKRLVQVKDQRNEIN